MTGVEGYAVTIDGVRVDYFLTPLSADGTCGCSIALPFSGGRHTVIVSAYNSVGEAYAPTVYLEPTAQPGGPYAGAAGTPVAVDGSASFHLAGTIVSYEWNWGDGTSTVATSPTSSHVYASGGTFVVTLTVTDNADATALARTSAAIAPPVVKAPPVPSDPEPSSESTLGNFSSAPTLRWSAPGATSYDVYLIASGQPPLVVSDLPTESYTPGSLVPDATYFWQVIARNSGGSAHGPVWTFRTSSTCPCTIWNASDTPGAAADDHSAVELGMKFTADVSGRAIGVRFYKDALNTGTHIGNLWTIDGQLLATVTFATETASGWQQALFIVPVPIEAGTTYVVSYHTDTGSYVPARGALESEVARGPLRALASAASGGNGLYLYGASAFPSQTTANGMSYWVDVVFER